MTVPPNGLTGAYELYCPGTPVGTVVLNDAVTTATMSPASPSSGQSFSLTGYQTVVNIPQTLASAAQAVNPAGLMGSATAQIDASGAAPAATPEGPLNFNVTFPNPIPAAGVALTLPDPAITVGGFTATSGAITIQEDSAASVTLMVAGNPLALTCTAYPNNSVTPSGITTSTPTGNPIAPVIAVAGSSPATPAPTALTSSLSGAGQSGTTIVVPWHTPVVDQATLRGANAPGAGGVVAYIVYKLAFSFFHTVPFDPSAPWGGWFLEPISSGGGVEVANGFVPGSNLVTLDSGVYFWQALYFGDALNGPSQSSPGLAIEIVLPPPCPLGFWWTNLCLANLH
jgi:hypothetical protein